MTETIIAPGGVDVIKIDDIRILTYLFSRQEIHSSATMAKK